MATRRIADEPAYILHSYDWSESSLILDVFTRHRGRVTLVAKGAKKPTSNFRPVLLPLQALHVSYSQPSEGAAEVHPLKGAQWLGGHVMPSGEALLAGLYLNELLLRLLARDDPHAALFDLYGAVVRVLASEHGAALEPVLRAFELLLLRHLGLLPELELDTQTQQALQPDKHYALQAEAGLQPVARGVRAALRGAQWQQLQQALDSAQPYAALLRCCADMAVALKPQLRAVLQYHCGTPMLRTRQLLMDLQTL